MAAGIATLRGPNLGRQNRKKLLGLVRLLGLLQMSKIDFRSQLLQNRLGDVNFCNPSNPSRPISEPKKSKIDFGKSSLQFLQSESPFWPEPGPKSPVLDLGGGSRIGQSEQSESRFWTPKIAKIDTGSQLLTFRGPKQAGSDCSDWLPEVSCWFFWIPPLLLFLPMLLLILLFPLLLPLPLPLFHPTIQPPCSPFRPPSFPHSPPPLSPFRPPLPPFYPRFPQFNPPFTSPFRVGNTDFLRKPLIFARNPQKTTGRVALKKGVPLLLPYRGVLPKCVRGHAPGARVRSGRVRRDFLYLTSDTL